MEPIYVKNFTLDDLVVDRFGFLKPSAILYYVQEVAGQHFSLISRGQPTLEQQGLFWAVIRHRVQITRLPSRGETIRVETWPMPTTRTAYPRSVVAYDEENREVFRSVCLWVLMDRNTRAMVLPGRSGVLVEGILRGNELPSPGSLMPMGVGAEVSRRVCFTDLDINGHMNNCRYLDWAADVLPSNFHGQHRLRDFTLCYLAEAKEGDELRLGWELRPDGTLRLDIRRSAEDSFTRVFSADFQFST